MGNFGASCEEVLDKISQTISASLGKVEQLEQFNPSLFQTSLPGRSRALELKIANFLVAMDSDLDKNEKVFDQLCSQMDDAAQSLRDWLAKASISLVDKESLTKSTRP